MPDPTSTTTARLRLLPFPDPTSEPESLPDFPLDAFPPDLGDFILASAFFARTRPELVAAPFLALTGAVIGNQAVIDITASEIPDNISGLGWIERPTLWISLIAPTGAGKSPALDAARLPFDHLHDQRVEDWYEELSEQTGPPVNPPVRPVPVITGETSLLSIVQHLRQTPGLAIVRDELIGIVRSMNQHRSHQGDDRQRYLSLWNHQPLTAPDRRPSTPIRIEDPVVSIVGGIQYGLVRKLQSRDRDGFIERFLPVVADLHLTYWNLRTIASQPEPDLYVTYVLLNTLVTLHQREPHGVYIALDRDTATTWASWFNQNVDRTLAAPDHLRGYYQKLPAHVARIALVLHLLWHPADPPSFLAVETLNHAIRIGEFFRAHIHRLVRLLGYAGDIPTTAPTLEQRLLRTLAETITDDGWLSRTHLFLTTGHPPKSELATALDRLVLQRLIDRRTRRSSNAKRPTTEYRLI